MGSKRKEAGEMMDRVNQETKTTGQGSGKPNKEEEIIFVILIASLVMRTRNVEVIVTKKTDLWIVEMLKSGHAVTSI